MRIIAGQWKRKQLIKLSSLDNATDIRPTSDRVRENIFNILENLKGINRILNSNVMDVYCGTGALGFEALSRGATFCRFIDYSNDSIEILKKNIQILGAEKITTYSKMNALQLDRNDGPLYDIVFLDPPYGKNLIERTIDNLKEKKWVAESSLFVAEMKVTDRLTSQFKFIDKRIYGKTEIRILSDFDF